MVRESPEIQIRVLLVSYRPNRPAIWVSRQNRQRGPQSMQLTHRLMIVSFMCLRRSGHIFYAIKSTETKTFGTTGRGSVAIPNSFPSSPTNTRWGMQTCACLGRASRLLLVHQSPDGRLPHRYCKWPPPPKGTFIDTPQYSSVRVPSSSTAFSTDHN